MRNLNYLKNLNASRNVSKFDLIYESIMNNLEIYKNVKLAKNINDVSLSLILEEIEKPQYIVCESSSKSILLEEAIFMDEEYLISEGVLEKVGEKIQQIIDWIKEGIKKVLSKASDMIKAFCERVKNNKVVAAIRKKLGLDEKLKSERFKNFIKVKSGGKEVAVESILNSINDKNIISEAAKLTKKEKTITNPKELDPIIQKWEDVLAGKRVINNVKTGLPLSKRYAKTKLRLLKRKRASLKEIHNETDVTSSNTSQQNNKPENDNINTTTTDKSNNVNNVINIDELAKAEAIFDAEQSAKKEKNSKNSKDERNHLGDIHLDLKGINNLVISVKDESLSDESIKNATKDSAIAIGGEEANKVISGDTTDAKDEKDEKKGFFGRLGDKVNKAGNKLKEKIQSGIENAKKWFNSQNKFVKILICCIIAILVILSVYFLITSVIYPILYGILNGGVVNAIAGIFRIYISGKTFAATYKQGKKSWQTGEGWGKTFLLIGSSILATLNLGQMAVQGSEMMAAAEAENVASTTSGSEEVTNASIEPKQNSIFDVDGNGYVSRDEIIDAVKDGKVPGIDITNARYSGMNGWDNFKIDLLESEDFQALYPSYDDADEAIKHIEFGLQHRALDNLGTNSASFSGNSWFHHAFGLDPTQAENAGRALAKAHAGGY